MITFYIDVLIFLCASWWFVMKATMKYVNINYSLLFFILFSMFFISSRSILFNVILICSFIKHSNQKSIYQNERVQCAIFFFFFIVKEQIKFDVQFNSLHRQVSRLLPCCLWKQQHHSLLDIKLSLYVSQELKNAFVHCSFLSR